MPKSRRAKVSGWSRRQPASTQETTLDLLWISEGVACFAGGRPGDMVYRAVLALEGPAHTPRALAAADSGALAGYRAFLNRLDQPIQVVIRPEPFDTVSYAARWESRAARLPGALAALAREHAAWARGELPDLGLLHRSAHMVVSADDPTSGGGGNGVGREGFPGGACRGFLRPPERVAAARIERVRAALEERCTHLINALGAAGVVATRTNDLGLATLYRACWNPSAAATGRTDGDLAARFGG